MSSLKTVLIEDSRLQISEDATFAVKSCPAQSTYQPYQATSVSESNITFNVQVPSENIVIDRSLFIQSDINLKFTCAMPDIDCVDDSALCFDYAQTDALQAYPLNSLFLTTQCTINNASVSENTQDIMAPLLAMYDKREINRFNSTCPATIDNTFGMFKDATGGSANVLSGGNSQGQDKNMTGRGAHPVVISNVVHNYLDENDDAQSDDSLLAIAGSTANTWTFYLKTTVTEPFLALSPWLNVTPDHERAGLMGINNMAFVINIDSACKRVFSTANTQIDTTTSAISAKYITNIQLQAPNSKLGLQNTQLLFNYLSMSPEQMAKLASPKNVVPYITYPRYLSSANNGSVIPPQGKVPLVSQSLQLSMIPDKLIVCVRNQMSGQNWAQANAFLAIEKVSVTFNNASGLLASATAADLYSKISYVNGSGQTWLEFGGAVQSTDPASAGESFTKAGLGSVLVLDPAAQFSLPPYLSASSLGQFQLMLEINVRNQFEYAVQPEIVIIAVNSGVFSTVAGSSQISTGMLTKEAVLSAKAGDVKMTTGDYDRLVGGSRLGSVMKRRIGVGGTGYSGGGYSGGGISGGAKPILSRLY
jgi:hypothetical protein